MADESDKSVVTWHPRDPNYLILPDPAFWTSLCLYHDQVIVCSNPFEGVCAMNRDLIARHSGDHVILSFVA